MEYFDMTETETKELSRKDKIEEISRALEIVKRDMAVNEEIIKSLREELENSDRILETNGKLIASIKQIVLDRKSSQVSV